MLVLAVEQRLSGTVKLPVYGHEAHLLLVGKSMQICDIFSGTAVWKEQVLLSVLTMFWPRCSGVAVVTDPVSGSLLTCVGRIGSCGWCRREEQAGRSCLCLGRAVLAAGMKRILLHLPDA